MARKPYTRPDYAPQPSALSSGPFSLWLRTPCFFVSVIARRKIKRTPWNIPYGYLLLMGRMAVKGAVSRTATPAACHETLIVGTAVPSSAFCSSLARDLPSDQLTCRMGHTVRTVVRGDCSSGKKSRMMPLPSMSSHLYGLPCFAKTSNYVHNKLRNPSIIPLYATPFNRQQAGRLFFLGGPRLSPSEGPLFLRASRFLEEYYCT